MNVVSKEILLANEVIQFIEQCAKLQKNTPYTQLLEEGELFTRFNKEYSVDFQKENDCQMKECFYNAQKCALFSTFRYYEGFVLIPEGIPIHHAWLVDEMDRVIDPTWTDMPDDVEYFGLFYETKEIFALWDTTQTADSLLFPTGDGKAVNW